MNKRKNSDRNAFVGMSSWIDGGAFSRFDKLNILWFDNLIIEDVNGRHYLHKIIDSGHIPSHYKSFIDDFVIPVSQIDGGKVREEYHGFSFEGYPRWEDAGKLHYKYPDPENPYQAAHNALLSYHENRCGVQQFDNGYDIEQAEGSAKFSVDNIRLWALVNKNIPCCMTCDIRGKIAINEMINFASGKHESFPESDLIEFVGATVLPDVSQLSWKELLEVKRSGDFRFIVDKITELYSEIQDFDGVIKNLSDDVKQVSRKIIIRAKPKPIRSLMELIVTNIPGAMFNPYGVFVGYKKFLSECREASDNQWIYTMFELEDRVHQSTKNQ